MNIVNVLEKNKKHYLIKDLGNGLFCNKVVLNGHLINIFYTDLLNKRQGPFRHFDTDNVLVFIEHYKDDVLHGDYILWSSNIIEWLEYDNGNVVEDKFKNKYTSGIIWKQISQDLREKYTNFKGDMYG